MQLFDNFNLDNTSVCNFNAILEKEGERMTTSAEEARINVFLNSNNVLIHVEEEAARYMLRDMLFTDHYEHFRLHNNLVKYNTEFIGWN